MRLLSCQCSVRYSLNVLSALLPLLMTLFFFLQLRCQQICSLSPTRGESGHVRSLACGPEQSLDVYAVEAAIPLMLAKNEVERIYFCFFCIGRTSGNNKGDKFIVVLNSTFLRSFIYKFKNIRLRIYSLLRFRLHFYGLRCYMKVRNVRVAL